QAIELFRRLVSDAGANLTRSTDGSREAIEYALKALTAAAADARRRIDESAQHAGRAAADTVNQGLREVLDRVTYQMETFQTSMSRTQELLTTEAASAAERSRNAVQAATEAAANSASQSAQAVREGFGEALGALRADVDRISAALKSAEASFAG